MEQSKEHINDLIIQLLSGELSAEEQQELKAWIDAVPENRKYFNEWQEIWFSSTLPDDLRKYDSTIAYKAFVERMKEAKQVKSTSDNESNATKRSIHLFSARWMRYAAMVVVVCLMGYIGYRGGQSQISSEFADIVVQAPQGSRTNMQLPDGTTVWLNAGSKLTYSQGFGIKNRKVELEGEGYFEVKKNAKLPFSVSSAAVCINDIGTAFNFRDYPNDAEAEIVLAEGAISLDNLVKKGQTEVMSPGDRVVLDKHTGKMRKDTYDAELTKQWTAGQIVFDGESLNAIASKIERSYNVKVVIASPSLKQFHFYGNFKQQETTLRDVLDVLEATGKLRYRIDKNKVTLY